MQQATNVKAMPVIHPRPSQVKSYQPLPEVEDVNFNEVAAVVKKKVTVVYNHFNLEAILVSAMLKNCYPEFTILTAAQVFDRDSDLYVWIGVGSEGLVDRDLATKKVEHMEYSSFDAQPIDENGYRPNLIDRVCNDFKVRLTTPIVALSYAASNFFKPTADLKDLVMVYNELLAAVDILNDVENPIRRDVTEQEYIAAMGRVKKQMERSYQKVSAKDGNVRREVFYTNFHDHSFIMALRLIKLSHSDFINHVASMGNNLIFTSLYEPVLQTEMPNIVVLN